MGSGPDGSGYVKHESVVMEQLVDVLRTRGITAAELFNSIDENGNGEISLAELKTMVR